MSSDDYSRALPKTVSCLPNIVNLPLPVTVYPSTRRPRGRLRKRKKGMTSSFYQKTSSRPNSLKVIHRSTSNNRYRNRDEGPVWGALHKAWVGFVIAKSQEDYEKMRKYAIVIRKFERRLNIEINEFPELGLYGLYEDFDNKEEDDDSRLSVIDPRTNEKIRDAKEEEDDN